MLRLLDSALQPFHVDSMNKELAAVLSEVFESLLSSPNLLHAGHHMHTQSGLRDFQVCPFLPAVCHYLQMPTKLIAVHTVVLPIFANVPREGFDDNCAGSCCSSNDATHISSIQGAVTRSCFRNAGVILLLYRLGTDSNKVAWK